MSEATWEQGSSQNETDLVVQVSGGPIWYLNTRFEDASYRSTAVAVELTVGASREPGFVFGIALLLRYDHIERRIAPISLPPIVR